MNHQNSITDIARLKGVRAPQIEVTELKKFHFKDTLKNWLKVSTHFSVLRKL